jgi:hypothetical protein
MSDLPKKMPDTASEMPLEKIACDDIDPEHLAGVIEALTQAHRGEFATDVEVAAAFRKFGA